MSESAIVFSIGKSTDNCEQHPKIETSKQLVVVASTNSQTTTNINVSSSDIKQETIIIDDLSFEDKSYATYEPHTIFKSIAGGETVGEGEFCISPSEPNEGTGSVTKEHPVAINESEDVDGSIVTVEKMETVTSDYSSASHNVPSVVSSEQLLQEEILLANGDEGVAQQVEVSSAGGIGSDFFVGQNAVVQLKEEEIIDSPGASETEMSVAMEMAKLSQGFVSYGESILSNESVTSPYIFKDIPSTITMEKPRMSYAQLIAEALMSRDERMMTLSEIYNTINKKHPYYRMDVKSWQNAIRHNLTLNPCFTKIPRPSSEGRGNFWKMEDGSENVIFRRHIRSQQQRSRGKSNISKHPIRTTVEESKRFLIVKQNYPGNIRNTVSNPKCEEANHRVMLVQPAGGPRHADRLLITTQANPSIQLCSQKSFYPDQTEKKHDPSLMQKNGSIVFIAIPAKKKHNDISK